MAFALGTLAAFGCLLAALFEVDGFGGPRDQGPRPGYLIVLALGFVASVLIPVLLGAVSSAADLAGSLPGPSRQPAWSSSSASSLS